MRCRGDRIVYREQAATGQLFQGGRYGADGALGSALINRSAELREAANLADYEATKLHESRCQHHQQLTLRIGAQIAGYFVPVARHAQVAVRTSLAAALVIDPTIATKSASLLENCA